MTTIANLIDRIYRDYLTPPGEQPSRFQVGSGGINTSSTTLPITTTMLTAELVDLIGVGTLIEGESGELMLVEGVTGTPTPTALTVRREMYETEAAALSAGAYLFLAGDDHKPRKTVYDAVCYSIDSLWPRLYQLDVWESEAEAGPTEIPDDARTVIGVEYRKGPRWLPVPGWHELRNHPYVASERAVQLPARFAGAQILVHYRRRPLTPEAETDELSDLNVEESWAKAIVVGAVAQVVSNSDIDRATIDFITEALENAGVDVGDGADIRNSLLQYQDYLIGPLRADLATQEDDRVVYGGV